MEVDPSTIMRWVHRCAPELEKRARAYQGYGWTSWRVDETYLEVGGRWKVPVPCCRSAWCPHRLHALGLPTNSCGTSFSGESTDGYPELATSVHYHR